MKSLFAKSLIAALASLLTAGSAAVAGTYRIDTVQPYLPVRTEVVYRPGAVYAYSPVTPTVTYYAPPAVAYPGAAPVVLYRPGAYLAPPVYYPPAYYPPVYYPGRAVVIRPKVYVRGQPVRNALRAVTP